MSRLIRLACLVLLLALVPAPVAASTWTWPLDETGIARPFDAPRHRYAPGHRGVDLPGRPGQTVRAVAAGRVTFAGRVAGVDTITVDHGSERSTYQPVEASVEVGEVVVAGQPLGRLRSGHGVCPAACLHLGRRRGEDHLDPADLLPGGGRYVLISPEGPPPAPPSESPGRLPVPGPVTSPFGMRVHPITGERRLHDGVDVGAPCGTPVRAVAAGTVTWAGARGPYGLQIEVRHGDHAVSVSHLSSITVRVGDRVVPGDLLGRVGSTGMSTGCHVHVMRLEDGRPVDPLGAR